MQIFEVQQIILSILQKIKSKKLFRIVLAAIIPLFLFTISKTAGVISLVRNFFIMILSIFVSSYGKDIHDDFIIIGFASLFIYDMFWASTLLSYQEKANNKKVTESFEVALSIIFEPTEKLLTPLIALFISLIIFALANETIGVSKLVGISMTTILTIVFTFIFLITDKSEGKEDTSLN